MIHEDLYKKYVAIRSEEVKALNEAIRNIKDKEVHWYSDFPYVTAQLSNCNGHLDAKVMAVKYPVSAHSGILIMPDEVHQYYEVGYNDIQFGEDILDVLSNKFQS
jgi:hypothetical protein